MKRNRQNKNYIPGLATLLTMSIFVVCVVSILFTGAGVYSNLAETGRSTYETRTCTGFIAAKVRQADGDAGISAGRMGESDALVFSQLIEGDRYNTYIYCHDGWLMEYFADAAAADIENDSNLGSRLVPAENLSVTLNNNLLTAEVTIPGEKETVNIYIRSEGGGTHEE